jgi:hypothetical protein
MKLQNHEAEMALPLFGVLLRARRIDRPTRDTVDMKLKFVTRMQIRPLGASPEMVRHAMTIQPNP